MKFGCRFYPWSIGEEKTGFFKKENAGTLLGKGDKGKKEERKGLFKLKERKCNEWKEVLHKKEKEALEVKENASGEKESEIKQRNQERGSFQEK